MNITGNLSSSTLRRTTAPLLCGVALVGAFMAPTATGRAHTAADQASARDCPQSPTHQWKCIAGLGTKPPGGRDGSVSHKPWPRITGVRWQVIVDANSGETFGGTRWSDWILGRNGSDHLSGGDSADVIWGDSNATVNGSKQRDILRGEGGSDYIYASHGHNEIDGGPGNDHITAFFGRGTVDCGPGRDTVRIRRPGAYRLKNCESVTHP